MHILLKGRDPNELLNTHFPQYPQYMNGTLLLLHQLTDPATTSLSPMH